MPLQVTFDPNPGKLQDMVNTAINHALINHSNVLSNTVYNVVVRTFKEGQTPPLYVGPAYHQPGLSTVAAPSAPSAVAGTEVTSPPSTLGLANEQLTPMRFDPMTSGARVQLNTDLSASAMSGFVFQNCQVPPNWWGYGMPLEFFPNSSRMSQVNDSAGKALMPSAHPISPMTQIPQYSTTTTARPVTRNFQAPTFQMPNANSSANPLPTQQRFMSQASYVNPAMTTNYQPSANFGPMNTNNGWTRQLIFPHATQQNHQVAGVQQCHMQVGFENQAPAGQPMNLAQQIGGQQAMANMMFAGDRVPQRHVEAYQQVLEVQPVHRQDADAYWADKIAEVMRDQFGIKPKVNTYSYRTLYPPVYDLIPLPNRYKVPHFTKFSGQDDTSTMEHVNRFIIQCGEAAKRDELRVRLFSSSQDRLLPGLFHYLQTQPI